MAYKATSDDWKRTAQTFGAALDLAEAQIAQALSLDAEGIVNERSVAYGEQRLYAIQCVEVALSYVRRIFGPPAAVDQRLPTTDANETFALTADEAAKVQSWYYGMDGDIILDDQDRQLARRLGNFAHAHGIGA